MSNNKQIEKPLELPHQETIVGINTIQTKPFDNQKEMSNNKQTSIDWFFEQLVANRIIVINGSTYWDKVKTKYETLLEQAKAMHKEEIERAHYDGSVIVMSKPDDDLLQLSQQYYNETFEQ